MAACSRILQEGSRISRMFRCNSALKLRITHWGRVSASYSTSPQPTTPSEPVPTVEPSIELPGEDEHRERFIPISRRSLMRNLLQEEKFFTEDEKKKFEEFAVSLDTAITNHYHSILVELKALFDPINPDKDTIATRKWLRREKLDNEFWLLQKLALVMQKANFHELPKQVVEQALDEHTAEEGVKVSVDPNSYDVLRYWALGRETPIVRYTMSQKLQRKFTGLFAKETGDTKPMDYYKRVVVAVRPKTEEKLLLKMFKEVPIKALEQLLPDGKIKMTVLDKYILSTSIGLGALALLVKAVTFMAHMQVQWTLLVVSITGIVGIQAWTGYKNRHNRYLAQLSRMLYFKNVANNRGLLTLLVDRAEDELFKETILTYSFLLAQRPPSHLEQGAKDGPSVVYPVKSGGITSSMLEQKVEDWVYEKTNENVEFDSDEPVKLLESYGILTDSDSLLTVHPLDAALRNLPTRPTSLVTNVEEFDLELEEGYEREYYERESVYKSSEKRFAIQNKLIKEYE